MILSGARMKRFAIVCITAICLSPAALKGQDRDVMDRRWALHYNVGLKPLIKPVLTKRPPHYSPGNSGSAFTVTGEYYMPEQWNLLAGYYRTEVENGYGLRTMEGLRFGAKKYFLPRHIVFQPYVAAMGEWNWGKHTIQTVSSAAAAPHDVLTVNPRLSVIPGAGFELYLFSSVALTAEYDFNIGINSHSSATYSNNGQSVVVQDKGLFHSVSIGLKATFPFSLTQKDAEGILFIVVESLLDMLHSITDDEYY
jgi:hypothetical protein